MKRFFSIILICLMFIMVLNSNAENQRFVDEETGISFDIPEGWEEIPNTSGDDTLMIQYSPTKDFGQTTVTLAVFDLYTVADLAEYGINRNEIDFSYLSDDLLKSMLGPLEVKKDEIKQYGSYKYRVFESSAEYTKYGLTLNINTEIVITLINGYVFSFQYMIMKEPGKYHAVFEDLLASVQID